MIVPFSKESPVKGGGKPPAEDQEVTPVKEDLVQKPSVI